MPQLQEIAYEKKHPKPQDPGTPSIDVRQCFTLRLQTRHQSSSGSFALLNSTYSLASPNTSKAKSSVNAAPQSASASHTVVGHASKVAARTHSSIASIEELVGARIGDKVVREIEGASEGEREGEDEGEREGDEDGRAVAR